jgi:signal peptidase I
MQPTLVEGDQILVNKFAYGARLPLTPLSLPFSGTHAYSEWVRFPYFRFPGYSSVQHNDVIVFNFPLEAGLPVDERRPFVKRCVALPGDTLLIKNGVVYINGKIDPLLLQFRAAHPQDSAFYNPGFFPNSSMIRWNGDQFGPLYIPRAGDSIVLDRRSALLYQRAIENYERNSFTFRNDSAFINGRYAETYEFKMDYFFTLGDNRANSSDSRTWGLLPEDHLIGKASFILNSDSVSRSFTVIR